MKSGGTQEDSTHSFIKTTTTIQLNVWPYTSTEVKISSTSAVAGQRRTGQEVTVGSLKSEKSCLEAGRSSLIPFFNLFPIHRLI